MLKLRLFRYTYLPRVLILLVSVIAEDLYGFLFPGVPYHALFTPSELSLSALKHCRRRKARTVFSDPQLTGKFIISSGLLKGEKENLLHIGS